MINVAGQPLAGTTSQSVRWCITRCISLVFALLVMVGPVNAVDLPPSATAGGAQPQLQELSPRAIPEPVPFPIPPVIDRSEPGQVGPKITVTGFVIRQLREWPEQDITQASLAQWFERVRMAQPQGFSIAQLQEVANALTVRYRQAGFILAQAYLPVQNVTNGIVEFAIQEGRLGQVFSSGNALYQDSQLQQPFQSILGEAVRNNDIEQALLRLNDYPGLSVVGVFQPGVAVGETDLSLQVTREKKYGLNFGVDNYGSKFTGEYRGRLSFAWNNPFASADVLRLSVLHTVHPSNTLYGAIAYQRRLADTRYSLGLQWSRNRFEVGRALAQLGIKGETQVAQIYLSKELMRSRALNTAVQIDISRKAVDSTQLGEQVARDVLGVISAEWRFDGVDAKAASFHQGHVRYSRGYSGFLGAMDEGNELSSRIGSDEDRRASGDFGKFSLAYTRLQRMRYGQSVLVKLKAQYSNNKLTSIEQLSLGGPFSVRAYPNAQALVDKGAFVALEWILGAPGFAHKPAWFGHKWGELLQLSLFLDYAGGRLNHALDNEHRSVDLKGVGLGLELRLPHKFTTRLDVAKPIGSLHEIRERDTQYFINLQLQF